MIFLIAVIRAINCFNGAIDSGESFLFKYKAKVLKILRNFDPYYYIRVTTLLSNGAFDAIAPYHETLNAVYSNLTKRPEVERSDVNKNTAIGYACLRILKHVLPEKRLKWERVLRKAGLDPDDESRDVSMAVGIGNFVAEKVLAARLSDGMNQEGDENGVVYNQQNYEDTLSYRSKNSEFHVDFPNYWQPGVFRDANNEYRAQVHLFPQLAIVKPYSLKDLSLYEAEFPVKSFVSNMDGYVAQVQEILRESYTLDDRKKMAAEYFNDKVLSLEGSLETIIRENNLTLDEYVFLQFAVKVSLFDSGIIIWREKLRYDAVRPFTAIKYLYGNTTVKSWGGVGVGPVDDMKGNEWKSYIYTPAHSEYPSASSCFCSSMSQVLRRYFKTNTLNQSVMFAKGSSKVEPCHTPSTDVKLTFRTYDDFVRVCGLSRLYGGVHFIAAINEGQRICQLIGDSAFDLINDLTNGKKYLY